MADLKAINSPGIRYSAFLRNDGQSFVHFVVRADEEAQKTLGDLASFEKFRRELKESGPESLPNAESLTLVEPTQISFRGANSCAISSTADNGAIAESATLQRLVRPLMNQRNLPARLRKLYRLDPIIKGLRWGPP